MEAETQSQHQDAERTLDQGRVAALLLRARRARGGPNTPGVDPGTGRLGTRVVNLATDVDSPSREPHDVQNIVTNVRPDRMGSWMWPTLLALGVVILAIMVVALQA